MAEYAVRFILGGVIVTVFAILSDLLRPKSFAGLFGAAPSVALATLGLAVVQHGAGYAAVQARAMTLGAIALGLYSLLVCQLLLRARLRALPASLAAFAFWLAAAVGLHLLFLGGT